MQTLVTDSKIIVSPPGFASHSLPLHWRCSKHQIAIRDQLRQAVLQQRHGERRPRIRTRHPRPHTRVSPVSGDSVPSPTLDWANAVCLQMTPVQPRPPASIRSMSVISRCLRSSFMLMPTIMTRMALPLILRVTTLFTGGPECEHRYGTQQPHW